MIIVSTPYLSWISHEITETMLIVKEINKATTQHTELPTIVTTVVLFYHIYSVPLNVSFVVSLS